MLATQFRTQLEKILTEDIERVRSELETVPPISLGRSQGELAALRRVLNGYIAEAAEKADKAGR